MNTQKQNNTNNQRINHVLFKSGLAIIFMVLICIAGCNKDSDGKGRLEVMGKKYRLDHLEWIELDLIYFTPTLYFYSSDFKTVVILNFNDSCGENIPIGTFKIEESTSKPTIKGVALCFLKETGDVIEGVDIDDAILEVKKSGNNYNFTLKGKVRFGENAPLQNYKLTYKKPL
ncbi:MAG: hypothetical protein FWC41_05805 [Firmicutes bacterium]|nr:hypothetical protein [Bacillota bacterium]